MTDQDWTGYFGWPEKCLCLIYSAVGLIALWQTSVKYFGHHGSITAIVTFLAGTVFCCGMALHEFVHYVRVNDSRIYIRSLTGIVDRPLTDIERTVRTYGRLTICFRDGKQKAISSGLGDLDSLNRYIALRTTLKTSHEHSGKHRRRKLRLPVRKKPVSAEIQSSTTVLDRFPFLWKAWQFGSKHQRLFRTCVYSILVLLFLSILLLPLILFAIAVSYMPAAWLPKSKEDREFVFAVLLFTAFAIVMFPAALILRKVMPFLLSISDEEVCYSVLNGPPLSTTK